MKLFLSIFGERMENIRMKKLPVFVIFLILAFISCVIVYGVYFTADPVLFTTGDSYGCDRFYLFFFGTIGIMTLLFAYLSSKPFLYRFLAILIIFLPSITSLFVALKYGASINSVFISNVLATTWKESSAFLNYQVFAYIFLVCALIFVLSLLLNKLEVDLFPFADSKVKRIANAVFVVLFLFTFHVHFYPLRFYYTNLVDLYQTKKYILDFTTKMTRLEKRGEPSAVTSPLPGPSILFVHLGESVRTDHAPMNGYKRNTMPNMMEEFKKGNLYTFPTTLSFAATTQFSVIGFMTPTSISDNIVRSCSFMKIATDMGIQTTAFFSCSNFKNVTKHDMAIDIYTQNISNRIAVPGLAHTLLPQIKKEIDAAGAKNQLMFYQGEGSHIPYASYEKDRFSVYTPVNFTKNNDESTTNAYDNTIVCTDDFIGNILSYLKNKNAVYIFASDHGENMGENGIWGRTGQNRMDNPSVRKVLFFIWVSDKFKKECPNKYAALIRNSKNLSAVSHENIYHTVLGFYNITNKIYKKELDLFTNDAKPFAGPMPENIPHGTFFDKVNFIE